MPWGEEKSGWTDERVETLKTLWGEGLSASVIAGELGGVTRNAVIGKVHRLGLTGRGLPTTTARGRRRRRSRRETALRSVSDRGIGRPVPSPGPRVKPEDDDREGAGRVSDAAPIAKQMAIGELTERTCKWPVGDPRLPGFCFCGHEAVKPLPYCEFHSGIAYQSVDVARDAARLAATACIGRDFRRARP